MNPAGPRRRGGKPATPRERVLKMHQDYMALGQNLQATGRQWKCSGSWVRELFEKHGLAIRPTPNLNKARQANGGFARFTPMTKAQIEKLIREAKRIAVPVALRLEWRQWDLERRAWFIGRLREQLNQPVNRPQGPFSANVEPFDYGTPRAHEVARMRCAGLPSNQWPIHLKLSSAGVIWHDWLWFWCSKAGYIRGNWLGKGLSRLTLHHEIWKLANGREIPKGCVIRAVDGNPNNLHPSNLALETMANMAVMNRGKSFLTRSRKATEQLFELSKKPRTQKSHARQSILGAVIGRSRQ